MKRLFFPIITLTLLLATAYFLSNHVWSIGDTETPEFYVGVAFCGNTTAEAKLLIDRVKSYTNLFLPFSGPVSMNETALTEICEYAVDSGLSLIPYFGDLDSRVLPSKGLEWRRSWIEAAKQRWGDKFLGVHYYDEPGGIYLDFERNATVQDFLNLSSPNYDRAANLFLGGFHRDDGFEAIKSNALEVFVSDYGLYWFDYLAGYDVILAQAGWNHTLVQDIALARGAAKMQNKEWGLMITWKYRHPPYLDSGESLYQQMRTAYLCGAKYIAVFNYPSLQGNEYGVMTDEHLSPGKILERDSNQPP